MIYSFLVRQEQDHLEHLKKVFTVLHPHKLYVKPEKCTFAVQEIEFLCFIVGKNGLKVDPKKIQTVIDWPTPRNILEVQQTVGFVQYVHMFVNNFSCIVMPLIDVIKHQTTFQWTQHQ